jgi:guanine deaminase
VKLYRANVLHTPRNPFLEPDALETFEDAGVLVRDGRILETVEFSQLENAHPDAQIVDLRPGYLLPGFVDCHVHFPQVAVIGAMGLRLLDWLETRTLPFEAKLVDADFAREVAQDFLTHLVRNGTTTAMVFGAHFKDAMHAFFQEAERTGLRITSGMVLSDRMLRPELHQTTEYALESGLELIQTWHGRGRLRYAVMPRFSLSCSNAMLAVCRTILESSPGVFFHTHINENPREIETVLELFPDTKDYLGTYEKHALVTRRSVFAHSVHPTDSELERLGRAGSSIAHCASSNAFIGSGLFPLRRHLEHKVRVALGSDVGGGTGFSLLKEGLQAYQAQMLQPDGVPLSPAHLLYLATLAGAEALELHDQIGDFTPGKAFDAVLIRPRAGSTLERTLSLSPNLEAALGSIFTLGNEDCIASVWVAGENVLERTNV